MVIIVVLAVAFLLAVVAALLVLRRCYHRVAAGEALVVHRPSREPLVTFTGALVLPIVQRAERIDVTVKTIVIRREGANGLICRDNLRADLHARFLVGINRIHEDVLRVAQAIGCQRAGDPETLRELFEAKFSEALKTVGKQLDFAELFAQRDAFRDQVIQVIGQDLNGYCLQDLVIDHLEQTPLSALNPDNVLDAQGIERILAATGPAKAALERRSAAGGPARSGAPTAGVDPDPLLPAPKRVGYAVVSATAPDVGGACQLRLSSAPDRLELEAEGSAVATLRLDRPFEAALARAPDGLQLGLRQAGGGVRVGIDLSAPRADVLAQVGSARRDEASLVLEQLPAAQEAALAVAGRDLWTVLAAVRHAQGEQGVERWGS